MALDELWANLRQGARNVAGVSWQVSTCAYLLVEARAGRLPFVELTPEGYEDADCVAVDGTRTFVQMKELDGGHGRIGPSGVAGAVAHAETSARGAQIAVLTDGSLGSDLSFTGWGSVLGDQAGAGIDRVLTGLTTRGYTVDQASDILARTRVVQVPFRVGQTSEAALAEALNVHPTVAGIAISRLTELLARDSGDQRHATGQTAARVRISDLDAIVAEVQDAVDVKGLDTAVSSGVCSPVSFLAPDEVPARIFYLGVDGRPGHVAANLDVIRPDDSSPAPRVSRTSEASCSSVRQAPANRSCSGALPATSSRRREFCVSIACSMRTTHERSPGTCGCSAPARRRR